MAFVIRFTDDGAEVGLVLNWQRLREFARNLAYTVWFVVSLLLALKAAGIDVLAFVGL